MSSRAKAHVRDVQYENIREIASLINSSIGLPAILSRIALGVCKNTGWDSSAIMAIDREAGVSEQLAHFDPIYSGEVEMPTRWILSISASLRAVDENRPLIINASNIGEFPELQRDGRILGLQSWVMLPLGAMDDRGREMTLSVHSRAPVEAGTEEISFLLTLAHLAAIAINKEKQLQHERGLSSSLKRAFEIGFSLIEQELVLGSLDALMQRIEIIMKHPFVLMDHRTGQLLAHRSPAPDEVSNARWPTLASTQLGEFFAELSKSAKPSDFQDAAAITLPIKKSTSTTAIIEPLHINNIHVGTLIVFPPENGMNSADQVIAQAVRFAINVQFLRDYFLSREESGSLSALFGSILDGSFESEREVHGRARQLGIDLQKPARLLAFDVGIANVSPAGLDALNRAANSLKFKIAIAFKENLLVAYVPEIESSRSTAELIGKDLTHKISINLRKPVAYTKSERCTSLADLASAFGRCSRVLLLARHLGKEGRILESDFGALPFLLASADQPPTRTFVAEILDPIAGYDRANNTDLLNTIKEFVDRGRKFQATARALGIHLSTLRYRIGRVKEVFGVDPEDPDVAFNFSLAFRIKAVSGLSERTKVERTSR